EVNQALSSNGARVDTWHKVTGGSPATVVGNERWTFKAKDGMPGYGQLVNLATGKCLEINGANGSVDQWTCADQPNVLWRAIANDATGGVALQSALNGQVIATEPGQSGDGTGLVMQPARDGNSSWTLSSAGN